MLAILLVHLAGSGQLSGEIANKKPLASLMANSLGTVMHIIPFREREAVRQTP